MRVILTLFIWILILIFILVIKESSAQTLKSYIDSSDYYMKSGEYEISLDLAKKALSKSGNNFSDTDTNYLKTIDRLADLYTNYLVDYDSAAYYYELALNALKKIHKKANSEIAVILNSLGNVNRQQGKFDRSEHFYKQALEMTRELYGKTHTDIALVLNNIAVLYVDMGRYDEAAAFCSEAIIIFRELYKEEHLFIAWSLGILAGIYQAQGKVKEAGPLYEKSLKILKMIFKEDNTHVANGLNDLAFYYDNLGRYDEAEKLYLEALEMNRRLFGDNSPNIALNLNNLACIYMEQGKLLKAEKFMKESIRIDTEIFGIDHPHIALRLNNLATVYEEQGKYEDAEILFKKAFEVYSKLYDGDNSNIALSLNNLGGNYAKQGKPVLAEKYFRKSLEMRKRIFQKNHPDIAANYNNLSGVFQDQGKLDEAEEYQQKALGIFSELYNGDHPFVAISLNNLATINNDRGNFIKAKELLTKSLEMRRRLFRDNNPVLAKNCIDLAYANYKLGKLDDARPLFFEGLKALVSYYNYQSLNMSERDKALFWNTLKYHYRKFNNFAIKMAETDNSILIKMYENRLFSKGMLLNSTKKVKNRILNSGDSALIDLYYDWQFKKNLLSKYYKMTTDQLTKNNVDLDSVEQQINEIEKNLCFQSEAFKSNYEKKNYSYRDIKNALNPGEAAIEIVRFRNTGKKFTDTVYYAVLIAVKNLTYPHLVLFENGNELESTYIKYYGNCMKVKTRDNYSYNRFWAPIADILKQLRIKKVYLSPDGVYNKLNVSTLYNPRSQKYVIDEMDIRLIGSSRDLVTRNNESKDTKTAVLIGNPKFDIERSKYSLLVDKSNLENSFNYNIFIRNNINRNIDSTITRNTVSPLPGTEKEVAEIDSLLRINEFDVITLKSENALEEAIKSLDSPGILHIATHGLFLKDLKNNITGINYGFNSIRLIENPLLRSMILLAGAEKSIFGDENEDSMVYSDLNSTMEDGLLTAFEAQNLNLDNTELVVLSACETGLGEIKNGEGVYGLQRAFQVAGAKTIIMSLWKVADDATQNLMTEFYKNMMMGLNKSEAFRNAQLALREHYSHPYFWGAFVMIGE